jgi:hypothetical protein
MKVSKACKARIKRMTTAEKKALIKACALLADANLISDAKFTAIRRCMKTATDIY